MGIIESKTFKSGNSVSVRLPKELGFKADERIVIEQGANGIHIRHAEDPDEGKRRVARLVAALRAIGPAGEIEERPPFDLPERPGL